MNKKILASIAMVVPLIFSQAAIADNETAAPQDLNQQALQDLSKGDLLASTQDYMLEETVRPQARRSALFAHILDTVANSATMAKIEKTKTSIDS